MGNLQDQQTGDHQTVSLQSPSSSHLLSRQSHLVSFTSKEDLIQYRLLSAKRLKLTDRCIKVDQYCAIERGICQKYFSVNCYVEKLKRVEDVRSMSHRQAIQHLKSAVQGFLQIYNEFGKVIINCNKKTICLDAQGKLKVWVNQNFGMLPQVLDITSAKELQRIQHMLAIDVLAQFQSLQGGSWPLDFQKDIVRLIKVNKSISLEALNQSIQDYIDNLNQRKSTHQSLRLFTQQIQLPIHLLTQNNYNLSQLVYDTPVSNSPPFLKSIQIQQNTPQNFILKKNPSHHPIQPTHSPRLGNFNPIIFKNKQKIQTLVSQVKPLPLLPSITTNALPSSRLQTVSIKPLQVVSPIPITPIKLQNSENGSLRGQASARQQQNEVRQCTGLRQITIIPKEPTIQNIFQLPKLVLNQQQKRTPRKQGTQLASTAKSIHSICQIQQSNSKQVNHQFISPRCRGISIEIDFNHNLDSTEKEQMTVSSPAIMSQGNNQVYTVLALSKNKNEEQNLREFTPRMDKLQNSQLQTNPKKLFEEDQSVQQPNKQQILFKYKEQQSSQLFDLSMDQSQKKGSRIKLQSMPQLPSLAEVYRKVRRSCTMTSQIDFILKKLKRKENKAAEIPNFIWKKQKKQK